jgi:hypothetical protein
MRTLASFILLTTLVTLVISAPTQITNNNAGDITKVEVDANVNVQSQVDVKIIDIIMKCINDETGVLLLDEDGNIIPPNLPWNQE